MKIDNEHERLLCYSAGLLTAILSNPNNLHSSDGLIPWSIKVAKQLIEAVYKEEVVDHDGSD